MKINKTLKALAVCTVLAGSIGVVASCSESGTTDLAGLIIDQNKKVVTADFELPSNFVGFDITWTSSNENVIKVESSKSTDSKGNESTVYIAKVTRPEVTTDVTLTAHSGNNTKDFTVTVSAIDAFEIADKFSFQYKNATLPSGEYQLPINTTYSGKEATINWAVEENEVATVNSNVLTIDATETLTKIELTATFSYNGTTATKHYRLNAQASIEYTAQDKIINWYNGVYDTTAVDINGYVVNKVYNEEKKGYIVLIIDESYTAGVYCYYPKFAEGVYDKLDYGTAITLKGATSQSYNGLIETDTAVGEIVLNEELPAFDSSKAVTAVDEEIFAAANSKYKDLASGYTSSSTLKLKQSTEVTLSGWKVKAVTESPNATKYADLVTLSKTIGSETVDVKVSWSYYYSTLDTATQLINQAKTLAIGDVVDVKGFLNAGKDGYNIMLTQADNLKKSESTESTFDLTNVYASLDVFSKINFPETVVSNTTLDEPKLSLPEGAKISYKIYGFGAKYEEGKFSIEVTENVRNIVIRAFVTYNGFTFTHDYKIIAVVKTADEQVQEELDALVAKFKDTNAPTTINLTPEIFTNVTFEATVKEGQSNVQTNGNKLALVPGFADTNVVLTITAKSGDVTKTKDVTVKVSGLKATPFDKIPSKTGKFYVAGTVGKISGAYGNNDITINGQTIAVYGMYDVFGNKYDSMVTTKPVEGQTVILYGSYKEYEGTPQISGKPVVVAVGVNLNEVPVDNGAATPEGDTLLEGTINGAFPENLVYVTNNEKFPNCDFYSDGGAKFKFVGQGVKTVAFATQQKVSVTFKINALNDKQGTGNNESPFEVYGYNAAGELVATTAVNSVVIGDNTVILEGKDIVSVFVKMINFPISSSGIPQNVSFAGITIKTA